MVNFKKFEKALGKANRTKHATILSGARMLLNRCELFGIAPHEIAFHTKISIIEGDIEKSECLCVLFRVDDEYEYDTPVYFEKTDSGLPLFSYDYEETETLVDNESVRLFLDWLDPLYCRDWANA